MQEVLIATVLVIGASLLGLLHLLVLMRIRAERDEWEQLMAQRTEYEAEAPIMEALYGD
jgi:Tfp pilus assembly protein PilV